MSENQNNEYKESWRDEYLKWICGFANALGGHIFIGIDDRGNVIGIDNHQKLLEDIPNKAVNHLGLVVDVNLHAKNKSNYIEIVVPPSTVPISYRGVYYYRSGSTKQELKGTALQQFLLKKIGKTWDDIPVESATFRDIDEKAVQSFLKKSLENKRISPDAKDDNLKGLLTNLRLINKEGQLKYAALLLFGKDPLKHNSSAYFKIGRFGVSDSDLRFHDVIEGNIFEMPDKVLHIAEIFFKAGYIEAWGRGISRIMESCRSANLPEPVLEEYAGGIQITFRKDIYTHEHLKQSGLGDRLIQALLYMRENGKMTNAMYQKVFAVSKRTATYDLQLLEEKELIEKIGTTGKGTSYVLTGS